VGICHKNNTLVLFTHIVHFSADKFAETKRIVYICNINLNFMVMKKVILLLVMVMSTIFSFAQDEINNVELSKKAADINAEANIATTEFNTTNASSTVKDAKTTIKRLKEAKSINKKLAKSQKKLNCFEKKIAKIKARLDDLDKKIKFVEQ